MKRETIISILLVTLFFILIVLCFLFLIFVDIDRPNIVSFCIQNGYAGAVSTSISSGYCYNPSESSGSIFDDRNNKYFAWDGHNWRFGK